MTSVSEPATVFVAGINDIPTYLYRACDYTDTPLYVGVAHDYRKRLEQHQRRAVWYRDAAYFTLELYPDRFTALKAEAASIYAESPTYNIDRPEKYERLWRRDLERKEHNYPVLWLGEVHTPERGRI
jgi:predicted GIY-YIG superfamily endonuclease